MCTYFDENFLNLVPAEQVEGLYGCLDYYRDVDDAFSIELLNRYEGLFPGSAQFTAGSACTGTYRALKFWEAAVNEAGSLNQDDIIAALDHARIAQGPGGPAEMVPGQHHVRMNMYIARSEGGTFNVVKNLGHIDPERVRGRTVREVPLPSCPGDVHGEYRHPGGEGTSHDAVVGRSSTRSTSCANVVAALDDAEMDIVSNCAPWTVRRLASHALNNQLLWAGMVTGEELVSAEETMGAVAYDGDLAALRGRRRPPRARTVATRRCAVADPRHPDG